MMKITKPAHKMKTSRGPPMRKEPLIKKSMHASASMRMPSGSSRTLLRRPSSPGFKRGLLITPPIKSVHSSRMRPVATPPHRSVNRHRMQPPPSSSDRGLKEMKYEKRKISSPSGRHPILPGPMREPSPFLDDRYLSSRPSTVHSTHYSPPPKKKIRRVEGGLLRRPDMPPHSEGRMVQRSEMPLSRSGLLPHPSLHRGQTSSSVHDDRGSHFDAREGRDGAPIPSHSKRPPPPTLKPSYQRNNKYQQSPPETSRTHYSDDNDKHYMPTLHERFTSVVESTRTEPRVKYSREDLEKITIDIHRNIKPPEPPTVRHIVNPNDVKLVRRSNEGHRPIFDREEIKRAPRDMRDDAHYERKVTGYNSGPSMGLPRNIENYEITRHRFDSQQQSFHSSGSQSLSDRWQSADARKDGGLLDRDLRENAYERPPMKKSFNDSRPSKPGDRDFRSERYPGPSTSQGRPVYSPNRPMIPHAESRNNSSMQRKPMDPMDARRKLTVRRDGVRGPPPTARPDSKQRYAEKRYPDGMSAREKPIDRRPVILETPDPWGKPKSRSHDREIVSFSRKPDKYSYKSGPEKYDGPSKRSTYYEGSRESSDSYRGRGSSFRSPRGRSSRGISRGGLTSSTFRGGYRGRGAPRRGHASSYEQGIYSRSSDSHKMSFP